MSRARSVPTVLGLFLAASPYAAASIVSVTGATTQLSVPPTACTLGALAGVNAFAWDEKQNTPLSLAVNMTNNPGTSSSPIPGVLSGAYDSHFIHFEALPGAVNATGTVTFSAPILGVIFLPIDLDNSDGPAGAGTTIYPTNYAFRGLASNPPSFFSINTNTLAFNFNSLAPAVNVIQVRVLTQTPTPGSAAILGIAAAACGRRRRCPVT